MVLSNVASCATVFFLTHLDIIWDLLHGATLKAGSRKPESGIRNPESETGIRNRNRKPETGIRNPESTNQRKQVLHVRENCSVKAFVGKK